MKKKLEEYFDRLFKINRSLTGNGNRETLKILSEIAEIKIHEIPSGTKCLDWVIPPEWNVNEAWVKDRDGNKIIDFAKNNLHLLGYSTPFSGNLDLPELKKYLYTLPEKPNTIPYITSYYEKKWGFCITENQKKLLKNEIYEVFIDSQLYENGSLTYGEAFIEGKTKKEILLSTYLCHPSMANDNLSGLLVTAFIYNILKSKNLNYSYRFLFIPETIGSIYYLSKHGEKLKQNLVAGFVVTTVGDKGPFTYKKSRIGNSIADIATEIVLNQKQDSFIIEDFFPDNGSDERQYCSPGFNLPVGSLMRTRYCKYKEYHTSDDDKSLISFLALEESINIYLEILNLIDENKKYINLFPFGEPQLGKRNLYEKINNRFPADILRAVKWVLNFSDGKHDLINIISKSHLDYKLIIEAARLLELEKIIKKV